MNDLKTRAREVSRAIMTGLEVRDVECFYRFNWTEGIKELIRTDTNVVVERSAITQDERQTVMNLDADAADNAVRAMVINENPRRLIELEDEEQ